jgi:predicted phosphodiesterase
VNSFNAIPHTPLKPDTMMLVAGNHDICFKQWNAFLETYKTSVYYFIVETPLKQRDLFIMYDSADGTLGKNQLKWLQNTLEWASQQNFRHIVAGSHTHFFMRDNSQGIATNYSIEETYTLLRLFQSYGVDILFTGHSHSREVTLFDELTCIIVDSMTDKDKKPAYLIATMGETIDYEFVNLPTKQ